MATKHLVSFGKPVENKYGYLVRTSTCGKFIITKRTVSYVFTIVETQKQTVCDSLGEARALANWEIDPNWEF